MQFVDAVTTTDVDQHYSQGDKDDKNFKADSSPRILPGIPGSKGVIAGQNGEDEQCDNLEGEARKGDVDTIRRIAVS